MDTNRGDKFLTWVLLLGLLLVAMPIAVAILVNLDIISRELAPGIRWF